MKKQLKVFVIINTVPYEEYMTGKVHVFQNHNNNNYYCY